ncbi:MULTISPECIES: hypothetical protein [Pontibacillus]|uniref:Uncharacterized protein n=1 Tax=Pontibacillus chungwhensis TaxID=265426 RepID=A0ABY8UZP0_9BACI|nr:MULTISPECIES: hypothetical protein [Pontibacillus]WIF98810.1 hypothetical protein QNI29_03920 [Pontibacillus chungwhensis]
MSNRLSSRTLTAGGWQSENGMKDVPSERLHGMASLVSFEAYY